VTIDSALLARSAERVPATGRGEATRQRLLARSRAVFESRGYAGATVAEIAKRAGVAHGTFYKYFESKDDIFRALTNEIVADMFDRTRQREHAPDAVTRITRVNWRYLKAFREDAEFLALVFHVSMVDPTYREFWVNVRQQWADTIERWVQREVRAGTADQRLDARVAARALGLMMESFAQHWFVLGEQYDDHTALTTLTQLWINALQLDVEADVDVGAVAADVLAEQLD
jgi:AcrR family transcriptional regulator